MRSARPTSHRLPAVLAALITALAVLGLPSNASALMGGTDWHHALEVIAAVNPSPPRMPLVAPPGGSTARECTVSYADWATKRLAEGGVRVATYHLGSRNQTFHENVAFMNATPQVATIVCIAVDLGRLTSPYTTKYVPLTPDLELAAGFVNRDFHDLIHLVEPGRPESQSLLAEKTAGLLRGYDMTPPSYEASGPAAPETQAAFEPAPPAEAAGS